MGPLNDPYFIMQEQVTLGLSPEGTKRFRAMLYRAQHSRHLRGVSFLLLPAHMQSSNTPRQITPQLAMRLTEALTEEAE